MHTHNTECISHTLQATHSVCAHQRKPAQHRKVRFTVKKDIFFTEGREEKKYVRRVVRTRSLHQVTIKRIYICFCRHAYTHTTQHTDLHFNCVLDLYFLNNLLLLLLFIQRNLNSTKAHTHTTHADLGPRNTYLDSFSANANILYVDEGHSGCGHFKRRSHSRFLHFTFCVALRTQSCVWAHDILGLLCGES